MKVRLILVAGATAGAMTLAGAGGASALVAAPSLTAKAPSGGKGSTAGTGGKRETYGTQSLACDDDNTVVYDGPLEMWPPNHKYRNLSVTATDDEPNNSVTLTVTGTHDEYLEDGSELNGSGNTDGDVFDVTPGGMASGQGSATTYHKVRGERSGRGDGRVYTFHAVATFSDGETCEGDFTSTVPHDQGKGGSRKKRARR